MCDKNINEVLNLDFASLSDENNWTIEGVGSVSSSNNVLNLLNSDTQTVFKRLLGSKLPSNNRLRIKSNLQVKKSVILGSPDVEILFIIKNNFNEVLEEFLVEFRKSLGDGGTYLYYLDRIVDVSNYDTFNLELKVIFGNEQEVSLIDLIVEDYFFCEDDLRSYFVIDGFFEDSFISELGGIKLNSWKIDDVETLTSSFFAETNIIGSKPIDNWRFAKANLDGTDRVAELTNPNTFNPFEDDLKLTFDSGIYYGGKPTGTENGSDFGTGILSLGIGKPAILNGSLNIKKGAFFIDVDYSKNLKVEFDVIINKTGSSLYVNPDYIRKYVIEWDALNCEKYFYFIDENGDKIDQSINGFLTGITGLDLLQEGNSVGCDETFSPTGNTGNFSYEIDFGTTIGTAGIKYNAHSVPDRFILEWNGQTFDSGFVGSNIYDQQLIDAGVDPADINTGSPSTGAGSLTFNKDQATPTTATVTVIAPLIGTGWQVTGICPQTAP